MKVYDLMRTNVTTVPPDLSVSEAARIMERSDLGMLPVCGSDGRLQGILTDRDIVIRCIAQRLDPGKIRVEELMTRGVVSISPEADVQHAANCMSGEQIRRLPVVDNQRLIGVLSIADLLHSDLYDMEAAYALTEITERSREY